MALSIPPPTQPLTERQPSTEDSSYITEPWYRVLARLFGAVDETRTGRITLTEDTDFFVRPGGNDTSGDGSANTDAKAFATPQGAYDYILRNVDAAGYFVKVKMAAGTYTPNSSTRRTTDEFSADDTILTVVRMPQNCPCIEFEGDPFVYSGNVIWDNADNGGPMIFLASESGLIRFQGLAFRSSGQAAGSKFIFCNNSCTFSTHLIDFGPSPSHHIHMGGGGCMLKMFGNYTISGGAVAHLFMEGLCCADIESGTCTLSNAPDFSSAFVLTGRNSMIFHYDFSYSGSATGIRYQFDDYGCISHGADYDDLDDLFPGDTNGIIVNRVGGHNPTFVLSQDGTASSIVPQINVSGRDSTANIGIARFSDDAFGGAITFVKSRSTSRKGSGAGTVPTSGDELGRIAFHGKDSTQTAIAAGIRALSRGASASNDMPGGLQLGTTPDGSGGTDTTWRWELDLNGHLYPLSDIAYDLGSSTLGIRNIYLGTSGVALGRTGTWTPSLLFNGDGTGVTYSTQIGRYVLVGDMITLWASIVLTSNGSGTGPAQISGIPINCLTLAGYEAIGTFGGYSNISTDNGGYHCSIQSADSRIDLLMWNGAGTDTSAFLTDTEIDDDAKFNICISYLVA